MESQLRFELLRWMVQLALDLEPRLVVDITKELKIDTAQNISDLMRFEMIRTSVERYAELPDLVTSSAVPAEKTGGEGRNGYRAHYVDVQPAQELDRDSL